MYSLLKDTDEDFSDIRKQVIDILRPISIAVSSAHHNGNLQLARRVAGLLSVDWSLKADSILLSSSEHEEVFHLVECEKGTGDKTLDRFSCWTLPKSESNFLFSSNLVYCIRRTLEEPSCLLQVAFPVTVGELRRLCSLDDDVELQPMRPGRWKCAHASWLSTGGMVLAERTFHLDFCTSGSGMDYRMYMSDRHYLVALALDPLQELHREWHLIRRQDLVLQNLSRSLPAKRGLPPVGEGFRPGPDSRLPHVLALLRKAPEKLELNFMSRPHSSITGRQMASMQTGVAFATANMAAPRQGDKEAASSILRMPIFGPMFGLRSRVSEPLAGREVSAACIGSVMNSDAAVLDLEGRTSRLGAGKQKEESAFWNKNATLKTNQALLHPSGCVFGPLGLDYVCRRPVEGSKSVRFCMGEISKTTKECLTCRYSYAEEEGGQLDSRLMLHRKRILEPNDSLVAAKKLRRYSFAVEELEEYEILRGKVHLTLMRSMSELGPGLGEVDTALPAGYELSDNLTVVPRFGVEVVYILRQAGLEPFGPIGKRLPNLPILDPSMTRSDNTEI